MRRSRKSIQLALLIGLQLQLTLMSVNLSGAFQFWASKVSQRSTRQQEQRTSAAPSVRHRLENAPQTTTTTTTPSATLASSGLQLELNAEPPEAARQPSDESSFELNTLNGSLILEDLVNQLKRNFNQMKRGAESSDEATDSLQYEAGAANRTNKPNERHLAEIVVEPTSEISLEILHSTGESLPKPTPNDSLVDLHQADQEDRHIQYDSMAATSSLATNEIGRVPVDETGLTAQNFTFVPLTESSNFTLDPIRVQSEQIVFNNSLEDFRRRLDADSAGGHEGAPEIYSNNSLLVPSAGESQKEQQARHKSHQARSMGNNSPRAAQLSKPPYASYNQFHESTRSQLAAPQAPPLQLVTTNNHNNRASLSDSSRSNSSPHQRAPNETGAHLTRASDIKLESGGELVNSMGRILFQLGGEPTRPQGELNATSASASAGASAIATTTTSTPATTTTARPAAVGDVIEHSYEFLRERQQAQQQQQLERMAPKLAPINDPIDLSPILSSTSSSLEPSSLSYSANGLNHQMDSGEISPNQFYFSQTPIGHLHESRSPTPTGESGSNLQRNFQNDPYSFDSANLIFSQQLSEPANQLFRTRGDNNQAAPPPKQLSSRATTSSDRPAQVAAAHFRPALDLDEASAVLSSHSVGSASVSASSLSLPFGPQLHRKTLELVSNQIQHADQVGPVQQHKERSPNSLEQQRGAGSHAASLINVTAPMVLPLSATEAMEASLEAAPQDLQAPHGHHQRPANYLAPRPTTTYTTATSGAEPTFGGAAQSLENSPANSLAGGLGVAERERLRVGDSARAPPSGFRSPFLNSNGYLASPDGLVPTPSSAWFQTTSLPAPSSYLSGGSTSGRFSANGASSTQAPPVAQNANNSSQAPQANRNPQSASQTPMRNSTATQQEATPVNQANLASTTNGFLIGSGSANSSASDTLTIGGSQQQVPQTSSQLQVGSQQQPPPGNKRVFNLTRVEHISAECSNDLIRTVIIFNGTFKGIIYSSGYVRDPNCLYVNGTGKTRYDFSIRLNQCGTLGRQELHPSSRPNELNRRDQVMWNTLSIQYNPIVEQEWDEHFRVSCEYGGDFWKTISFSPFNVETNTGSPVVFTVDPPQCQMEILKGHGMVGPRQEAVSGPVTVGDPLTLLIHMKSEKAGYDILVKNCIAHNGGQQKMQLIDNSGCVVNERFISPFRGTYNDNDLKHVTLYSYLKAFRFTGSPVLYLECEVHMCQSACPPQMCYWRTLSKRSVNETRLLAGNDALQDHLAESQFDLSDGAELEDHLRSIRFNLTPSTSASTTTTSTTSTTSTSTSTTEPSARRGQRTGRSLRQETASGRQATKPAVENLSDRVSLFQALEVRQEREPENLPEAFSYDKPARRSADERQLEQAAILCYRRGEVFAFLFTVGSILLAAISLTIGCCFRASSLKRQARHQAAKSKRQQQFVSQALSLTSANLGYAPLPSYLSPSHSTGSSCPSSPAGSSYASSSQHSPEVAHSKQSRQLPACPVSSLATLVDQQQQQQNQITLVEVAARKSACQTQFRG